MIPDLLEILLSKSSEGEETLLIQPSLLRWPYVMLFGFALALSFFALYYVESGFPTYLPFVLFVLLMAISIAWRLILSLQYKNTWGKIELALRRLPKFSKRIRMKRTTKGIIFRFKNILPFEVVTVPSASGSLGRRKLLPKKVVPPPELESPFRRILMKKWLFGELAGDLEAYRFEVGRHGVQLLRLYSPNIDLHDWGARTLTRVFPMLRRPKGFFQLQVLRVARSSEEVPPVRQFAKFIIDEHFPHLTKLIGLEEIESSLSTTDLFTTLNDSGTNLWERKKAFLELLNRNQAVHLKKLEKRMTSRDLFRVFTYAHGHGKKIRDQSFVHFLYSDDDALVVLAAKVLGRVGKKETVKLLRRALEQHLPLLDTYVAIEDAIEMIQARIAGDSRGGLSLIDLEQLAGELSIQDQEGDLSLNKSIRLQPGIRKTNSRS